MKRVNCFNHCMLFPLNPSKPNHSFGNLHECKHPRDAAHSNRHQPMPVMRAATGYATARS